MVLKPDYTRLKQVCRLLNDQKSITAISNILGVTKQRVGQIIKKCIDVHVTAKIKDSITEQRA